MCSGALQRLDLELNVSVRSSSFPCGHRRAQTAWRCSRTSAKAHMRRRPTLPLPPAPVAAEGVPFAGAALLRHVDRLCSEPSGGGGFWRGRKSRSAAHFPAYTHPCSRSRMDIRCRRPPRRMRADTVRTWRSSRAADAYHGHVVVEEPDADRFPVEPRGKVEVKQLAEKSTPLVR